MKTIVPTGVTMLGTCDIRTSRCIAREPSAVTVVFEDPQRNQINVCRPCLEEQIRSGEWRLIGARVRRRADIALYDSDRKLEVVVEVKRTAVKSTSAMLAWSRRIAHQLFAYGALPSAPFFMLIAFPRQIYLWKSEDAAKGRNPKFTAELDDSLGRFATEKTFESHFEMEKMAADWLRTIIRTSGAEDSPAAKLFTESGLSERLAGGSVKLQSSTNQLAGSSEPIG